MTTGSGLYLSVTETDQRRQNSAIRQLIEGRSNAVGTVTLAHDGVATTTTVTATNCGPNSVVFLSPTTAHAAGALATSFISSVASGQFVITHSATSQTDQTFGWVCLG